MRRAICVLIALSSVGAFAQKETVVQEPDRVVGRQKTTIDFGAVAIEANRVAPADSYVIGKPKSIFLRTFKVRGNFAPELQKSVDSL